MLAEVLDAPTKRYVSPTWKLAQVRGLLAYDERHLWHPQDGPQMAAWYSDADEVLFGGAAGGGKSDLALGLALFGPHKRAIIFRRIYKSLVELVDRSREILSPLAESGQAKFNENKMRWTILDSKGHRERILEFGAVQRESDLNKWRGRPHDLLILDELGEFTRLMYVFLQGWNRSVVPGQRTRVLSTANPPSDEVGQWMIDHWRLWLNPREDEERAMPGEIRWFATLDGEDTECDSPEPFEWRGELILPRSRTFIPSLLDDNAYLRDSTYRQVIMNMPEPLRSQLLKGDFLASRRDDIWQIIPTEWVREAQRRWSPERPGYMGHEDIKLPYTAMGVDPSQGGDDRFVIQRAVKTEDGIWFEKPMVKRGIEVPTMTHGTEWVERVLAESGSECVVKIDANGLGLHHYNVLKNKQRYGPQITAYMGSAATDRRDVTGRLGFVNVRAAAYWYMRDLLDPANERNVALPPDEELLVELTSVRWRVMAGNDVALEKKEDIAERIGRSPDKADAAVMCAWSAVSPAQLMTGTTGTLRTVKGVPLRKKSDVNRPFAEEARRPLETY